ncbi:glycoside hydrolase family 10 protein [Botryobasidium botryosum FD-172 SS1]|uniref:Beta-xylanase n=1 Tax=Botryobasidium botryosum (strain FD-172 SS1) TaxID=930990 RepID=A0A067LWV2_BOTB1|nr:glycoside hydrolase family 10 protein [Botryobasidium botryosum FD-172 SS1]
MLRNLGVALLLSQLALAAPTEERGSIVGLDLFASIRGRYVGVATESYNINNSTTWGKAYKNLALGSDFSIWTPENSLKWEVTEPQPGVFDFSLGDALFKLAKQNGKRMRGHTLAWHSQLPPWVTANNYTAAELKNILQRHVLTEVGHFKGQVTHWDVVNEVFEEDGTFRNSIWYKTFGPDYIEWSFRWARQADPSAKLYINDYNFESISPKTTAAYNLVKSLKAKGVPIDGVGVQAHLIVGQVPKDFEAALARFASLGVDVALTELDIRLDLPVTSKNLAQQAKDYKAAVDACLGVKRCVGITVWQVTDALSWVPSTFPGQGAPLLYDEKLKPKPAYDAFQNALLLDQWI